MTKYIITVPWSGYSRGYSVYEVVADSFEDAKDGCDDSNIIEREIIRDDTEIEWDEAEYEDFE